MPKVRISELVLDYNLYPRHEVNATHVADLLRHLEAGVQLPPIVVDKASKRVVDGFHRLMAARRSQGPAATIDVTWREYPDEAAIIEDAIRLNAAHGRKLAPYDRARCITVGAEHGLTLERIAQALSMTVDAVGELKLAKTVMLRQELTPIKGTLAHLAGEVVTDRQMEGNRHAGGMRPLFYLNQVINLLSYDLLDRRNTHCAAALRQLYTLLGDYLESGDRDEQAVS